MDSLAQTLRALTPSDHTHAQFLSEQLEVLERLKRECMAQADGFERRISSIQLQLGTQKNNLDSTWKRGNRCLSLGPIAIRIYQQQVTIRVEGEQVYKQPLNSGSFGHGHLCGYLLSGNVSSPNIEDWKWLVANNRLDEAPFL